MEVLYYTSDLINRKIKHQLDFFFEMLCLQNTEVYEIQAKIEQNHSILGFKIIGCNIFSHKKLNSVPMDNMDHKRAIPGQLECHTPIIQSI